MARKYFSFFKKSPVFMQYLVIIFICLAGILLSYLVYSGEFIFGSVAGRFVYRYFTTIQAIPIWLPIIVILILLLTILFAQEWIIRREKTTLLIVFFIAILLEILIHTAYPITLGTIVLSDEANSFYSVAMKYSPIELLSSFNHLVTYFPFHAQTNMPGKILLFQVFKVFTKSPRVMGYLLLAISTLGAPLLYGVVKRLFHDRRMGLYAFMLYVLIPARLFFVPILNTVTPVLVLLSLYLFLVYIDTKNMLFLWSLGFALYLLVFFEPSPLVTGIVFIAILAHAIGTKRLTRKELGSILLFPVLAFLCMYVLLRFLFSFDLFRALRYVMTEAIIFNRADHRNYQIWLGENIKEFLYSGGTAVVLIYLYQIFITLRNWKDLQKNILDWSMETLLNISLLATFLIVIFLGVNRGEVTRLWIYLAALLPIPVSFFLTKMPKSLFFFCLVDGTLVLQTMIALQRIGFILP